MNIKTTCLGTVGLMLLSPYIASADGRTLIYGNVSGWTVHTDPANEFACFAEARYEGGSLLRLGFRPNATDMYLLLADAALTSIAYNDERLIDVRFDDAQPLDINSWSRGQDDSVSIVIAAEWQQEFLRDFSASWTISLDFAGSGPVELSLGGSMNATKMLKECQSSMEEFAVSQG